MSNEGGTSIERRMLQRHLPQERSVTSLNLLVAHETLNQILNMSGKSRILKGRFVNDDSQLLLNDEVDLLDNLNGNGGGVHVSKL